MLGGSGGLSARFRLGVSSRRLGSASSSVDAMPPLPWGVGTTDKNPPFRKASRSKEAASIGVSLVRESSAQALARFLKMVQQQRCRRRLHLACSLPSTVAAAFSALRLFPVAAGIVLFAGVCDYAISVILARAGR